MDVVSVFAVVAGIVFLGFFAEQIFRRTNIPDVLLLIIVGIFIGTYLRWVDPTSFGFGATLFATFALVFLLFQGALSIDIRSLLQSLSSTLFITILTFFGTVAIVAAISMLLNFDFWTSLLIGTILGGTSSAVVIPLVNSIKMEEGNKLILTLESAISDVLCIIGTITVLEIMMTGAIEPTGIFNSVLSSFALALVVGVVAGVGWVFVMSSFPILIRSYLLTIAVVLGLYAFVESPFVGASGAIAALAFALVLGNSRGLLKLANGSKDKSTSEDEAKKKHNAVKNVLLPSTRSFYEEISFFVKTFFFVYLGILIDFSNPIIFLYGFLLTLGIFLIRPFVVKLVFFKKKLENRERVILEVLIPKGLAAAVLAGLAVQSGLLSETVVSDFVNLILSVVFISILITSFSIFLSERGFKGFIPFFYTKHNLPPLKAEAQPVQKK